MYIPRAEDTRVQRMVDGAAAGLRIVARSLAERAESNSKEDTPNDRMKVQNIGIALGVIIPIGGAIIVLTYLHRRHVKRQRVEDMNDPHKSLDFGLEGLGSMPPQAPKKSRRGKKGPEMIVTDFGGPTAHPSKRGHGMSFDLGVPSPYLLPAGLQGSKESIHSMSRNYDEHDPYRSVAMMRPSGETDRFRGDDKGSVYSMSTGTRSALPQDRASLIANARPMSITPSKRSDPITTHPSTPADLSPRDSHSPISRTRSPLAKLSVDETAIAEKQLEPLPAPPTVPEVALMMPPPRKSSTMPVPPRQDPMTIPQINRPESSNYDETDIRGSIMPNVVIDEPYDVDPSSIYADYSYDEPEDQGLALHAPQPQRLSVMAAGSRLSMVDAHRLSTAGGNRLSIMGAGNRLSVMGARPLPADMPEDNPEIRANRIRSFYKEYFDDSKPLPANAYYEDEFNNDLLEGVVYDPDSGGFYAPDVMPYAQPVGRRAMTPPPRSKPRVSGPNSPLPYPGQHFRKFSSHSTMSGGRGPMGYGGGPGARGRPMVPAKKLPPPMPLQTLPTPHKLGQDVWISNPIDFAPPSSIRNVQNGARPDSPFGMARPYSPSVRAFTPLASSFDALAVLPSPHDLRKSGTFTALDFAPPSRMRDPAMMGGGSDAGSIRSNRSGISAMQHQAVREGAYRVSRIPKEFVASREDLSGQLRPKMDMVSRA
ncbi:hypothetical protein TI39_contig350g00013 [Zymoseptoria brevis]|uniref:Uncharacterized protein n=1 Tax=Zymoseptoria brevis TaxID=1047168 RepID=A0A0F4GUF6_9PEZI|nr:hypothetical protein TI39_contig350g00013 [Zymoseptoria brevis]